MIKTLIFFLCFAFLIMPAYSASIIGSSSLMTQSYANQLESWLGEGYISVTRVFSKTSGDGLTASNFHAAVDGIGRTFTLLQVSNVSNQIIGGYNQISWRSTSGYNYTASYPSGTPQTDGTSFLFNLSNSTIFRQNRALGNTNAGAYYEAYNYVDYGPVWGGGHDLYVANNLQNGHGYASYSYGTYNWASANLTPGYASYTYSAMEVFTISNVPIPEASSLVCMLLGSFFLLVKMFVKR